MGDLTGLAPPTPLNDGHDLAPFDSGVATLDDWLKRRARANQITGASRTYVVAQGTRAVGYYCLAAGGIALIEAPRTVRRNMPDPIPMAIIGRLAVDLAQQHQGLGTAMLQDAVLRATQAAAIIGTAGILVHAISEPAKQFYLRYGFVPSPANPMTLVLSLKGAWA